MLTDLDYDLLSAYIDDALSESERSAFELRLQAEPELRSELDELRATVTLLNNLPALKAPRDFTLDARYARRSSFFFTSATFSALSTAAAVILFALGAYLFTGNKASPSATSSQQQVGQAAFLPTSTTASLDKAASTTATEPAALLNEVQVQTSTSTTLDSTIVPPSDGIAANDAVTFATPTVQPSTLPDQSPLFHPDVAQATDLFGAEGDTSSSSAAAEPSEMQQRMELTATFLSQESAAPSSGGSIAVPPAPSMAQAIPSTQVTEAEASTSMAFAATQAPMTATALPSATPLPSASPTHTATSTVTVTLQPTLTSTPTVTATERPTDIPLPPAPVRDADTSPDALPPFLIGGGIVFLLIAIATTLIRRRNRS